MIPRGYFNRSGGAGASRLVRLAGLYEVCEGDDFTHADLISLAVRLSGARRMVAQPPGRDDVNIAAREDVYYSAAYRAVCAGLNLPPDSLLAEVLHLRDLEAARRTDQSQFWHRAGLGQLLALRGEIIDYQDEWGHRLEGDIWGLHVLEGDAHQAVVSAQEWYYGSADALLQGFDRLDAAICAHLGWPIDRRVSPERLRGDFGFPDAGDLFDP